MMPCPARLVSLALTLVCFPFVGAFASAEDEPAFRSLFDGKSLAWPGVVILTRYTPPPEAP